MKQFLLNLKMMLKRYKTSSILSIVGLSVAFAVSIVVAIQAKYDFTYNKNFKHANEIYQQYLTYIAEGKQAYHCNQQIPNLAKSNIPAVKDVCILKRGKKQIGITSGSSELKEFSEQVTSVSEGFLNVFTPTIIAGSTDSVLSNPGKAIVSAKTADKLFGKLNPIGQVFYLKDKPIEVAAVSEDFPENCTLKNGIFMHMFEDEWAEWSYEAYYLMDRSDYTAVHDKLNEEVSKMFENQDGEVNIAIDFAPLTDIHLHYPALGQGSFSTSLSLLAIGVALLIIAFINFINFTIALAPTRVRSINVQKIFGEKTWVLRAAIALEAVMISLIAFVLACVYVYVFNGTSLSSFFVAGLGLGSNMSIVLVLSMLLLLASFVLGLYPAYYTTSLKVAVALKGKFNLSPKGRRLRNTLIVVQFLASIVLIIVALFIKLQHDYMKNYSWGIQKENIVYVSGEVLKTNVGSFTTDVLNNPSIVGYTTAGSVPGEVTMGWGRNYKGKSVQLKSWPVAPNFLKFFGVNIIYGNDFDESDDSGKEKVIFNQKFIDFYELNKEEVVGDVFMCFEEGGGAVLGIAENVNFESLRTPIEPMAFVILNKRSWWNNRFIFFKLTGSDTQGAINHIENVWKNHSDKPFELHFLDQTLDDLYKRESGLATLIALFALIAVVVAIMGVYGLVVFNTRYKVKEIGIRKVNGATEAEILFLLNKETLLLLIIAYVIAIPIAYYAVRQWLSAFAYKTNISWWVFAAAGITILIITLVTVSIQSWKTATSNPVDAVKAE